MKKFLLMLVCISLCSFDKIPSNILSNKAEFENNKLSLNGNVIIDYPFGKIQADSIEILQNENTKDFSLERVFFSGNISFLFSSGSSLKCDEATIDYTNQKISFYSENGISNFNDIYEKDEKSIPYSLSSKKIECSFSDQLSLNDCNFFDFSTIIFSEDVILTYNNNYKFYGNKAKYVKKQDKKNILGTIFLYPEANKKCLFTYENNQIQSDSAKINIAKGEYFLKNPDGIIDASTLNQNKKVIFSSGELIWHDFDMHMTLKNKVSINLENCLQLFSDEIEIYQKKDHKLKKIRTINETKINFYDSQNQLTSTLTCPYQIELDNDNNQITTSSFFEKNNDTPIIYHNNKITLSGNQACVKYDEKTFKPTFINLENNIRFLSNSDDKSTGYGVADSVEYLPQKRNLLLNAKNGKKVLFWQEDKSLSLSADKILIYQNPISKQEEIEGMGNVRFSFNLEEEKFFHNIFSQYLGD